MANFAFIIIVMLMFLSQIYCDFHGHSRKKNVFMYGCSISATNTSKNQGNSDAMTFEDDDDGSSSINDDVSSNSDENTGFKVSYFVSCDIPSPWRSKTCGVEKDKEFPSLKLFPVFKRPLNCTDNYRQT